MCSSKKPPWRCFSVSQSNITPINGFKALSKVKFNDKSFAFNHLFQFISNSQKFNIDEVDLRRIFTYTLIGQAKYWCLSRSFASIHSLDEIAVMFLQDFQRYNYKKVCKQLLELHRTKGGPLDQFSVKFKLTLILIKSNDLPLEHQLTSWFKYLTSLPCNSNEESHTKEDTNKVIQGNENIELGSSSSSKIVLIDSQSSNESIFESGKNNSSNTSSHSHNVFNDYKSTLISQSYNDNVPS